MLGKIPQRLLRSQAPQHQGREGGEVRRLHPGGGDAGPLALSGHPRPELQGEAELHAPLPQAPLGLLRAEGQDLDPAILRPVQRADHVDAPLGHQRHAALIQVERPEAAGTVEAAALPFPDCRGAARTDADIQQGLRHHADLQ